MSSTSQRRGPGRPSKEEASRELVLDAAETLFAKRDLAHVSVRDMSEASGVPLSSIYRYFSTKRVILLEVLARRSARVAAHADRRDGSGGDLRAMIDDALEDVTYRRIVLQAILAGVRPDEVPGGLPTFGRLLDFARRPDHPDFEADFDPGIVSAFLGAAFVGWEISGEFFTSAAGVTGSEDATRAEMARLMTSIMGLASVKQV